ncbi:MAG: DUF3426 domain-containing protein [Casimicrobiaceae bacterium]
MSSFAVADHTFTRCPGCGTVFRVTAEQLKLREGQVRCGHCRAVFDANDHIIALDAGRSDDVGVPDELAAGLPTITLRSAEALQPVDDPRAQPDSAAAQAISANAATDDALAVSSAASEGENESGIESETAESQTAGSETPESETPESETPESEAPESETAARRVTLASEPIDVRVRNRAGRFEWKPRKPLRERPQALYGVAILLLLLALVAQAVFEYRDTLAAHAPFTRPLLQGACDLLGCTIDPLRDSAALSIDASDLQADPAHRGLLLLSATLRNRALYPIAYPDLELTLTDSSDQVVVRRAFHPTDYIGGTSNPAAGIPGNGEKVVRLFIDASATSQAGYRLYLFYP